MISSIQEVYKKALGHPRAKQLILPMDLKEYNTLPMPEKEEAEGNNMSEDVSALYIWGKNGYWGKEWLMVLPGRICRTEKD